MYAVVFAASTHWALQSGREVTKENAVLRLNYKNKALHKMAQDVNQLGPEIPNETIYTMLSLAQFGKPGEKLVPKPYKPSQSVLARAHDLEFYSRLPIEWAHYQMLCSLLRDRGGLPYIARPGFAFIMSVHDVLISFRRLCPPSFPLIKQTDDYINTWPPPLQGSSTLAYTIGIGFNDLAMSPKAAQLRTILRNVSEITLAFDRFQRKSPDAPDFNSIIRARSAVVHDLLSLPDYTDGDGSVETTTYHLCHLGGMAYMLVCLYPLYQDTGPHEELSKRIKVVLEHASSRGMWESHPGLLLWASVLGGMLSQGNVLRLWYVEHLSQSGIKNSLLSWAAVSGTLMCFLWLESECDQQGQELWTEVWSPSPSRAASV